MHVAGDGLKTAERSEDRPLQCRIMSRPILARHALQGVPWVGERLWRLRKRQQTIDAILRNRAGALALEYTMNGRRLTVRPYTSRAKAIATATEKLKELERAGWATHW